MQIDTTIDNISGQNGSLLPAEMFVYMRRTIKDKLCGVTTWQKPEFVRHQWKNAWICSTFRNENAGVASELILDAICKTVDVFGIPPEDGMITFINQKCVKPTIVHGKPIYGWTYMKAGFHPVGYTKINHLLTLQMEREEIIDVYNRRNH